MAVLGPKANRMRKRHMIIIIGAEPGPGITWAG
jgi:hypothetical protein